MQPSGDLQAAGGRPDSDHNFHLQRGLADRTPTDLSSQGHHHRCGEQEHVEDLGRCLILAHASSVKLIVLLYGRKDNTLPCVKGERPGKTLRHGFTPPSSLALLRSSGPSIRSTSSATWMRTISTPSSRATSVITRGSCREHLSSRTNSMPAWCSDWGTWAIRRTKWSGHCTRRHHRRRRHQYETGAVCRDGRVVKRADVKAAVRRYNERIQCGLKAEVEA